MKTFCVVGGCGYLGYHIGKFFKKAGCSVILFDKNLPHKSWTDDDLHDILEGFTYIKGEVSDIEKLQNAFSGVDCVIHTAAFGMSGKEQMPAYWEETEQTNINGTVNVINAACSQNVKALVYTSTYNVVFGGDVIRNGDETLPYFPLFKHADHYSRTKCISEQLILIANSKCTSNGDQLKTCALRLAGLVGPKEQRHIMRIVAILKKGLVKIKYGDRNNHVDFVGLQNAVQAHVKAANALLNFQMQEVVGGQAYFISDGVPISNFKFFGAIIEGIGYKSPQLSVPVWLMYAVAYCIEEVHKLVSARWNFTPLITKAEVCKTGVTHHFSIAKARQHLHYEPVNPNDTSEIIKYLRNEVGHQHQPHSDKQLNSNIKVKSYALDILIGILFAMLLMSYLPIIM